MKIYRYMSKQELERIFTGKTVYNNNQHKDCCTDSVGFCFLPEKIEFDVWTIEGDCEHFCYNPIGCIDFLSGIVTNEFLVEFDVVNPDILKEGYGSYADPTYLSGYYGTIEIVEYSCTSYSSDSLVPLRYGFVYNTGLGNSVEWYNV